jgi:hypothetical protein
VTSHQGMNARLAFGLPMSVAEAWRAAAAASGLSQTGFPPAS